DWGLIPSVATGDCWYATDENLKFLRDKKIGFCFGLKSNRIVSNLPGRYTHVSDLNIPKDGLVTHLKKFGFIKVFKTVFKNQDEYFAIWIPELDKDNYDQPVIDSQQALSKITFEQFETIHDIHWKIEMYHRAIKQL
ncbi:MAG: IS701 family transposase, partial [Dolichospermum sp.]